MAKRKPFDKAKLIVIKIGSSTLTSEQGKLDTENLKRLVGEIAELAKGWKQAIVVSSGAVVTGSERLGLPAKPRTIPEKQAAAAVGQSLLMKEYEKAFAEQGISVGQVLLTRDAIADRHRYINVRHTLFTLLKCGLVPIVNENDTVAVDEIKIGDNDTLSALVASLMGADLLVIFTDTEGFYLKGKVSEVIEQITSEIEEAAKGAPGDLGTGGMVTKIQAARIAGNAGIPLVIAHGRKEKLLSQIMAGESIGTLFLPKVSKPESRKRWLAHGLPIQGTLTIDPGAEKALTKAGSSLLPVGIQEVKGEFEAGDAVSIRNSSGKEIARGLTNYGSQELQKIKGLRTPKIPEVLGYQGADEVVHRDNMVVL